MKGGRSYRHDMIVRGSAAERGQAAAEYAVILALVAAALIATYQLFGNAVVALYQTVVSAF
jgi:Flp pilus assembly pilin Flp